MKRAARTDDNQKDVVRALVGIGATVVSLAALGKGAPDLLVGYHGETFLIEVKDGSKPPSKRKLNSRQREWHRWWRGRPVAVVEDAAGAVGAVFR